MSTIAEECTKYKEYLEAIYNHAEDYIYCTKPKEMGLAPALVSPHDDILITNAIGYAVFDKSAFDPYTEVLIKPKEVVDIHLKVLTSETTWDVYTHSIIYNKGDLMPSRVTHDFSDVVPFAHSYYLSTSCYPGYTTSEVEYHNDGVQGYGLISFPRKVTISGVEQDMEHLENKNLANISELISVMRTLDRQPIEQSQRVDPNEHDLTKHTANYKYWLQKAWSELVLYLGSDPGCAHNLKNLKDQIIANVR